MNLWGLDGIVGYSVRNGNVVANLVAVFEEGAKDLTNHVKQTLVSDKLPVDQLTEVGGFISDSVGSTFLGVNVAPEATPSSLGLSSQRSRRDSGGSCVSVGSRDSMDSSDIMDSSDLFINIDGDTRVFTNDTDLGRSSPKITISAAFWRVDTTRERTTLGGVDNPSPSPSHDGCWGNPSSPVSDDRGGGASFGLTDPPGRGDRTSSASDHSTATTLTGGGDRTSSASADSQATTLIGSPTTNPLFTKEPSSTTLSKSDNTFPVVVSTPVTARIVGGDARSWQGASESGRVSHEEIWARLMQPELMQADLLRPDPQSGSRLRLRRVSGDGRVVRGVENSTIIRNFFKKWKDRVLDPQSGSRLRLRRGENSISIRSFFDEWKDRVLDPQSGSRLRLRRGENSTITQSFFDEWKDRVLGWKLVNEAVLYFLP